MDVAFFMIFGLPTETHQDREDSYQVVQSANVVSTKYNNLIPYPGTPLWTELKDSGRLAVSEHWSNFNSVLSITRSVFDKTPMPYVPESCSEWELKRDIIRYNLKSYVNMTSIAGIFGHTKGNGWFMLPERWYLKPREIYEVAKIGFQLAVNIVVTSLPLWLTEPMMNALNPSLKKRQKVRGYDPAGYKTVDWERIETFKKRDLLKVARDERKATGKFSVVFEKKQAVPATSEGR